MIKKQTNARELRHKRVRKKIKGTTARPRLCVSKSLKHVYVQIINDEEGRTLVSSSSLSKDFKDLAVKNGSITAAKSIGELVAVKAIEAGIKQVVFDRGGYLYHGQVKALAEAAREKGLVF